MPSRMRSVTATPKAPSRFTVVSSRNAMTFSPRLSGPDLKLPSGHGQRENPD
jgi:hypothetical protein